MKQIDYLKYLHQERNQDKTVSLLEEENDKMELRQLDLNENNEIKVNEKERNWGKVVDGMQ